MTITRHCIDRFRERVTEAPADFIRTFIEKELAKSVLLFSVNGVEKRYSDGLLYVVENKRVITMYPYSIDA